MSRHTWTAAVCALGLAAAVARPAAQQAAVAPANVRPPKADQLTYVVGAGPDAQGQYVVTFKWKDPLSSPGNPDSWTAWSWWTFGCTTAACTYVEPDYATILRNAQYKIMSGSTVVGYMTGVAISWSFAPATTFEVKARLTCNAPATFGVTGWSNNPYAGLPMGGVSVTVPAGSMSCVPAPPPPPPPTPSPTPTSTATPTPTPRGARADLSVAIVDSPDPAQTGSAVTYTVTVSNGGPDPASGAALNIALPKGATVTSTSASVGTCSGSGPIACQVGTLANGASATIRAGATFSALGSVTATASVTAASPDPRAGNNSKSTTTMITAPVARADLTGVWGAVTQTTSKPGSFSLVGTLTVKNDGLGKATATRTRFYLSADAAFDSGDTLLKDMPTTAIAAGQTVALNFTATVAANAAGKFVIAVVDAGSTVTESNEANNRAAIVIKASAQNGPVGFIPAGPFVAYPVASLVAPVTSRDAQAR